MSVEFFVRLAGMLVFSIAGIYLGVYLSRLANGPAQIWASVFAMVGALTGLVITPFLTTRPVRLIRARIADVARTGFLPGAMVVPSFVLTELQHIADSGDGLRRQRGRRGLDILNRLQKDNTIAFRISDLDVEGVRNVDDKLVILARQLRAPILTNDYNLNRVAELQGVTVLNINELANAVKAIYIPGESLEVRVIQEGKEAGQGVGYLDDGTMVVVEDGRSRLNDQVTVTVTKVLQTAAGRMIFARLSE